MPMRLNKYDSYTDQIVGLHHYHINVILSVTEIIRTPFCHSVVLLIFSLTLTYCFQHTELITVYGQSKSVVIRMCLE